MPVVRDESRIVHINQWVRTANPRVRAERHDYACAVAHVLTITEFTHQGGK